MSSLFQFLSGTLLMGFFVIGLFFLRFWKKTKDIIFLSFAVAFFFFSIERLALFFLSNANRAEDHPMVYLIRLAGFIIIASGIICKNKQRKKK